MLGMFEASGRCNASSAFLERYVLCTGDPIHL